MSQTKVDHHVNILLSNAMGVLWPAWVEVDWVGFLLCIFGARIHLMLFVWFWHGWLTGRGKSKRCFAWLNLSFKTTRCKHSGGTFQCAKRTHFMFNNMRSTCFAPWSTWRRTQRRATLPFTKNKPSVLPHPRKSSLSRLDKIGASLRNTLHVFHFVVRILLRPNHYPNTRLDHWFTPRNKNDGGFFLAFFKCVSTTLSWQITMMNDQCRQNLLFGMMNGPHLTYTTNLILSVNYKKKCW